MNSPSNSDKTSSEEKSSNPNEDEVYKDVDLSVIKGDAIGTTMYCERFVLKTLLSLQDISWSSDLESDLCTLWDMTTDTEVSFYLMENGFIDLAVTTIREHLENVRLVEILVGILANVCINERVMNDYAQNQTALYLITNLISYRDTKTLIQLMRFYCYCFNDKYKETRIIIWEGMKSCENFIENITFILLNNKSNELIDYTLKFILCLICIEFEITPSASDISILVNRRFIQSIITLCKRQNVLNKRLKSMFRILSYIARLYHFQIDNLSPSLRDLIVEDFDKLLDYAGNHLANRVKSNRKYYTNACIYINFLVKNIQMFNSTLFDSFLLVYNKVKWIKENDSTDESENYKDSLSKCICFIRQSLIFMLENVKEDHLKKYFNDHMNEEKFFNLQSLIPSLKSVSLQSNKENLAEIIIKNVKVTDDKK